MRDIRKYMDMLGTTPQVLMEDRKSLMDYLVEAEITKPSIPLGMSTIRNKASRWYGLQVNVLDQETHPASSPDKVMALVWKDKPPREFPISDFNIMAEELVDEAPQKTELQMMASKVLPRGAKESQYTEEMVYTKSGGLDSVATMEEKIIARLKEAGFTKEPSPGDENVFKLDKWVVTTRVNYGAGYKAANMSATLSMTDGVIESEELDEGSFVVKSLDGVEKRFKTLGPEATAWENSMSPKGQRQEANIANQEQARQEKDGMNATIWTSINGPWEWTELDWIDITKSFIVPDLISKLKGKPVSRTLKDAIIDARNGDLTPLLMVFDSVVRNRKAGPSFSSWANSMSGYGVKEDEEMGNLTLDEAPMSDSRKTVAQFLRSKGWVKSEEGKSRQGRRIWFVQRSPKNDIMVTKEEYVVQLLADMNAAGIQGTIGDGYERDSILGSDWTVTVQNDTGKIGLCLSMRDTPDDGYDW